MNLEEDQVGAVLLGDASNLKEGDEVKRTGRIISIPVGEAMIGRVVDALGRPIDGKGPIETTQYNPVERIAPRRHRPPAGQRADADRFEGHRCDDSDRPRQRELIIGDRQTGKTAVAVDAILNQKGGDMICVYTAIGQKRSTVAQVV